MAAPIVYFITNQRYSLSSSLKYFFRVLNFSFNISAKVSLINLSLLFY